MNVLASTDAESARASAGQRLHAVISFEEGGDPDFIGLEPEGRTDDSTALLEFGNSQVMFHAGGRPSAEHRREVDIRDLNRFWLTFGQAAPGR